jgi:hypothetical protein
MEEHAQNQTQYSGKCMMSCSACEEDARKVADLVEEKFSKSSTEKYRLTALER